jgi:hypothetical protein
MEEYGIFIHSTSYQDPEWCWEHWDE